MSLRASFAFIAVFAAMAALCRDYGVFKPDRVEDRCAVIDSSSSLTDGPRTWVSIAT